METFRMLVPTRSWRTTMKALNFTQFKSNIAFNLSWQKDKEKKYKSYVDTNEAKFPTVLIGPNWSKSLTFKVRKRELKRSWQKRNAFICSSNILVLVLKFSKNCVGVCWVYLLSFNLKKNTSKFVNFFSVKFLLTLFSPKLYLNFYQKFFRTFWFVKKKLQYSFTGKLFFFCLTCNCFWRLKKYLQIWASFLIRCCIEFLHHCHHKTHRKQKKGFSTPFST